MLVPGLLARHLVRLAFRLRLLNIRLLLFLVKIFGHEVENRVDAFLRIVLTVSIECHVVLAENSLEQIWANNLRVVDPHFADQLGPSLHESTLSSQRILILTIYQGLVALFQEVFGELKSIRQALDTAVHVAGIAQVAQTDEALLGILRKIIIMVLIQLVVCLCTAFIDMEFTIFIHATFIAILHIFAFANCSEDISRSAPLALADDQFLTFLEFECKWQIFAFPVLNDNVLTLIQINLVDAQSCIQQWLH